MEFHTASLVKSLYDLAQTSSRPLQLSNKEEEEEANYFILENENQPSRHHPYRFARRPRPRRESIRSTMPPRSSAGPPRPPSRPAVATTAVATEVMSTNRSLSYPLPPPTINAVFNTPSSIQERQTSKITVSKIGQWKDLQNTDFLAGNHQRYIEWKEQCICHSLHCVKQWPKDMPIFKVYDGGFKEHTSKSENDISLSKDDVRKFKFYEQFCITEYRYSIFDSKFCNHQTDDRTAWINLTNIILPGCGWTGSTPLSSHHIDDVDELQLFWNTDLSLYLHPHHPTIQKDVLYPLRHGQILMCPNVCVFPNKINHHVKSQQHPTSITTKTTKTIKQFHVLNIALDPTEWTKLSTIRMFQKIVDLCQMTQLRHIVLPIGRLLRMGISIQEISTSICIVFLPWLREQTYQKIEVLIPQNHQSNNYGDHMKEIVHSFVRK